MCTAGKTAPKLVEDFLRFDPQNIGSGNCLTEHPLPAGEGTLAGPSVSSCRHDYLLKTVQSVLPPIDSRPNAGTEYKTALLCSKCMIHADIHISYPHRATNPCPSAESPLHHFQYRKDREHLKPQHIRYGWQCSIECCHADVTISFRKTRISESNRELLGPQRLQERFSEVSQAEPDRNVKLTTPTAAMNILHRYLKDALDPTVEKRRLMANNKVFMATFGIHGRDCDALLTEMGFVYIPAQDNEEAQWTLPDPPLVGDRLRADGTSHREVLEDIDCEAITWSSKLGYASGESNPAIAARGLPSGSSEVERVLGVQNYPTRIPLTRAPMPNDLHPYFASLGALPNFTDALLQFAYDRQAICDPGGTGYYFECIQAISEYRGTEQLQIKVATLQSQDLVSRRDVRAAYRFLNAKEEDSDEHIINAFSARQSSCGRQAQEENREALGKIGLARQSTRLIKASKQELETYEDALSWLGAERTVEDGFIVTMLTIKTEDSPSDAEMARKAASIIAKERGGSSIIEDWLTGKTTSHEMSADEALRHLNIGTDLKSFDEATLQAIFESARGDRPGTQTEEAIAAIQKALSTASASRPPELWPVGLTSHGNTCYLNSLLQYYFSIKPLREIVLDYDKYKLNTTEHSRKAERVGQRIITNVEIKGGQKFADDLKHLFERMIKDRQPHVKPEQDLVCRAFLEPKDYALLTSEVRGEKQDAITNGVDMTMDIDGTTKESSGAEDIQHSDASSTTLVGDAEDVSMKGNDPPPTPPRSPASKPTQIEGFEAEPSKPPPLPPRRFSTTKEQALLKAEQNARQQQDVTEVHDGAMFRLRSGMIAKGMDERGEQQDQLRDIFEISLKENTVQEDGSEKTKVEANSSITTDVPNETTDVYVLLDKVFDLQDIPGTNKTTYKTIQTAPPLLQIAIPRIGYDSNSGAFKSEELVVLHDELYLDRYMDDDNGQVLPKRRTCWGWRKQLRAWKQERNDLSKTSIELDGPTALAETAAFVNELGNISNDLDDVGMGGIDVEPGLVDALESEAQRARARITELQQQIDELQAQFNLQFADLKNVKYELASVFIHRGGNSSGHYWIYIKDFEKDCWRKYNDETVTELGNAEFHELIRTPSWGNGTPTYAVYVREGDKLAFVQPVCREPEEVVWTNGSAVKTVTEGGDSLWDNAPRQVGDVTW